MDGWASWPTPDTSTPRQTIAEALVRAREGWPPPDASSPQWPRPQKPAPSGRLFPEWPRDPWRELNADEEEY